VGGLRHFAEAIYRRIRNRRREAAVDFLNLASTTFVEAEKDVVAAPDRKIPQPLLTTFDESYTAAKPPMSGLMLPMTCGDDTLKQAIPQLSCADDKDPNH